MDARGTSTSASLVERDNELSFLSRSAAASVDGARVVVVSGEAGIGKTRLCREFVGTLPDGWSSLRVTGYPGQYTAPFRSLIDDTGDDDPGRWADGLARTLAERAVEGPVVLVAEDVHWMDPQTAPVLVQSVDLLAGAPVLIVVTFRVGAHGPGSPVTQAVADLTRHPDASELRLNPLTPAGVGELAGLLGHPVDEAGAAMLFKRTGGVPLFVEELARVDGDIPWTLTEAVLARLSPLGEHAVDLAELLALAGRPLDERVVEAPGIDLSGAVPALVDAAIAVRDAGNVGLRHALVAEAVVDRMAVERRRVGHARLAAALETTGRAGPEVIAMHWSDAGQQDRAAAWLSKAMEREFRYGVRPVAAVDPEAAGLDEDGTAARMEQVARQHAEQGNVRSALVWAAAAESAYLSTGDDERAAAMWQRGELRAVGLTRQWTREGETSALDSLATAASQALRGGDLERARQLAYEVAAIATDDGVAGHLWTGVHVLSDVGEIEAANEVLAALRRDYVAVGDHDQVAICLEVQSWNASGQGNVSESTTHMRAALAESALSSSMQRQLCTLTLAFMLASTGELAESRELAEWLGGEEPFGMLHVIPLAVVSFEEGADENVAAPLASFLPMAKAVQAEGKVQVYLPMSAALARIQLESGRLSEALATVEQATSMDLAVLSPTRPDRMVVQLRAALELGLRGLADDALTALNDQARSATGPAVQAAATVATGFMAVHEGRIADARDLFVAGARAFEQAPRWAHAADAWCDAAEQAVALGLDPSAELDRAAELCRAKGLGRVELRVQDISGRSADAGTAPMPLELAALTPRELEVVRLVAAGHTNRAVADSLFLSEGTVGNYLSRAFDKLGVARRTELAVLMARLGELPPSTTS